MFSFWSYFLNKSGRTILIYSESIYNNLAYKDLVLHFSFTDTVCFPRSSRPEVFCKKRCSQKFRKINRKTPVPEALFWYSCRPWACNCIKKETLAQVFSCEFCEISKNTFSDRTNLVAASNFPKSFQIVFQQNVHFNLVTWLSSAARSNAQ